MNIEPDVMKDLASDVDNPSQSVPVEGGNNSGPRAPETPGKGDIDIKGTPDFMGGTPDAAGM